MLTVHVQTSVHLSSSLTCQLLTAPIFVPLSTHLCLHKSNYCLPGNSCFMGIGNKMHIEYRKCTIFVVPKGKLLWEGIVILQQKIKKVICFKGTNRDAQEIHFSLSLLHFMYYYTIRSQA